MQLNNSKRRIITREKAREQSRGWGERHLAPVAAEHSAGYSTSISLLIFNSDKTNSKIVVRDIVIIGGDFDANRRRANGNVPAAITVPVARGDRQVRSWCLETGKRKHTDKRRVVDYFGL